MSRNESRCLRGLDDLGRHKQRPAPYAIQIKNITKAPSEVADYVSLMASVIEEARQERFRRRGGNIEVNISTNP
jgi:hypothetical protein